MPHGEGLMIKYNRRVRMLVELYLSKVTATFCFLAVKYLFSYLVTQTEIRPEVSRNVKKLSLVQ